MLSIRKQLSQISCSRRVVHLVCIDSRLTLKSTWFCCLLAILASVVELVCLQNVVATQEFELSYSLDAYHAIRMPILLPYTLRHCHCLRYVVYNSMWRHQPAPLTRPATYLNCLLLQCINTNFVRQRLFVAWRFGPWTNQLVTSDGIVWTTFCGIWNWWICSSHSWTWNYSHTWIFDHHIHKGLSQHKKYLVSTVRLSLHWVW